jgi:hypothetical protein
LPVAVLGVDSRQQLEQNWRETLVAVQAVLGDLDPEGLLAAGAPPNEYGAETAFHDPAVEQDEALGLVGALDDRHGQVPDIARVADEPACVPGVGPPG